MGKSTMIELVNELEKRNVNGKYDSIIQEAKAGEFHDFKNEKYVCGKVELVNQLSKHPALDDIKTQVMNGEYDESPDKEDRDMMIKDLLKDPNGEAIIKALGLDKKD